MKQTLHRRLLAATVLIAGSAVLLAGCMGAGGSASSTTSSLRQARVATTVASLADASQEQIVVAPVDAYSSFQSKDPFVQQQVMAETTEKTTPTTLAPPPTSSTTTSTTKSSTTTSTTPPTTTPPTTTPPTTTPPTTNPSTTSTTSFFSHMLQIIKLDDVGGTPKVTFTVDNGVYTDKVVGDSVSTSWGEVKVVKIDMDTRLVTLLHDGQTLIMRETQFLFE
jgi:hypothetical protein